MKLQTPTLAPTPESSANLPCQRSRDHQQLLIPGVHYRVGALPRFTGPGMTPAGLRLRLQLVALSATLILVAAQQPTAHGPGADDCPCLAPGDPGFAAAQALVLNTSSHAPGYTAGIAISTAGYGLGGCRTYDEAQPFCTAPGAPAQVYPHWCVSQWCYVDRDRCSVRQLRCYFRPFPTQFQSSMLVAPCTRCVLWSAWFPGLSCADWCLQSDGVTYSRLQAARSPMESSVVPGGLHFSYNTCGQLDRYSVFSTFATGRTLRISTGISPPHVTMATTAADSVSTVPGWPYDTPPYTNFDIIFDRFSLIFQLHTSPHALWAMLHLATMLIGYGLVLGIRCCGQFGASG